LSAGLALVLGAAGVSLPTAAHGYVEGLPLYAPSSGSLGGGVGSGFPDKGFETLLPQVEAMKANIPALREAVAREDWAPVAAAFSAEASLQAGRVLGDYAGILGDEAYTAIGLKAQFLASSKKLAALVLAVSSGGRPSGDPSTSEALAQLSSLNRILEELLALTPPVVVEQVRTYEKRLAAQ